ncbi:lytic transglycosylase domain-containing protein [Cupriavidus basilensis]|uniref:Lytic transglycosylase domain-containing protein n=2 Tax=Cupriavidus basilensis TaxID=68895 RepID=A0A643FMJ3_9BURK|nr:lytic transglycosylase domain-containing protein [Cupriavidus basilensis]
MAATITRICCACAGLMAIAGQPVRAADIYRSEGPDGAVRFATRPLDKSYRLFLRDDAQRPALRAQVIPIAPAAVGAAASRPDAGQVTQLAEHLARKHAIDPALVKAVIDVESRGNAAAVSPKGATGAMQLLPSTAAMYGVTELTDPAQNIEAGIRHLKYLLDRHGGNLTLALAAYNAGEGAVARHAARIPPYRETMLYVPAVLARMQVNQNNTSNTNNTSKP